MGGICLGIGIAPDDLKHDTTYKQKWDLDNFIETVVYVVWFYILLSAIVAQVYG